MKTVVAALAGAAVGASLAVAALLTSSSAPDAGAGEGREGGPEGRAASGAPGVEAPVEEAWRGAAPPRDRDGEGSRPPIPAGSGAVGSGPAPELRRCEDARDEGAREVARLEREVKDLREKLRRSEESTNRSYDLTPAQLSALAARCELRWDHPPVRLDDPHLLPDDVIRELGLDEDTTRAVQGELLRWNEEILRTFRETYTSVTGDDEVSNLSVESMMGEINDKTPRDELQRLFRRLSAERAGQSPPPSEAALSAAPPLERLYRALGASGDQVERALAKHLGPETARALRDRHAGWGSKFASSYGCPDP